MKKLLLILFMVSILTFSVNAERFVNYEFQEALIDINDNVVTSSNDINGVSAVGFVCNNGFTDSSGERICTDLGSSLWDGNVITTSDNKMQLTYPTQLQSQYGYVVFFFKDGFIPWEQTPNWAGTDYRDPQGPLIKYLAKKDFCSAPISPISITNEDDPSLPIIIGVEVDVDAHTRSALESKGPIEEVPESIRKHYQVETKVSFYVRELFDVERLIEEKVVNLNFGETRNLEFGWEPTRNGDYNLRVVTEVLDDKCNSFIPQEAGKMFYIDYEYPEEGLYTLLQNLDYYPKKPRLGNLLSISVDKLTNEVSNGNLIPRGTKLFINILDSNGMNVWNVNEELILPANQDPNVYEKFDILNLEIPTDAELGEYVIAVAGRANCNWYDLFCVLKDDRPDIIYSTFVVEGNGIINPNPEDPPEDPVSDLRIISKPVTDAKVGLRYEYDVQVYNPDHKNLEFGFSNSPEGMTINYQGLIKWVPKREGSEFIDVYVRNNNDVVIQSFVITVNDQISKYHEFDISGLSLDRESIQGGEKLSGLVQLSNVGQRKETKIELDVNIPELNIFTDSSSNLRLGPHDSRWVEFDLDIPSTASGYYIVQFKASNKYHTTYWNEEVRIYSS